jgi:glycosyltransferase involved in cell wall biosynthesis
VDYRKIVKHGETGFVVEPKRPEQIADAIKLFVQNRDLVRTMGAAAESRAHSEFSIQRFVNEFVQVLEGLKQQ